MTLYSVPPLLTWCCFAGLATLTSLRPRKTAVHKLFLFLCLFGILLYTDILLLFNIESADTALVVSRIDHFFLAFSLPFYIAFFHSYLKIDNKALLRAAFAVAAILASISQTSLFISGMVAHRFGYFAKGGFLYPVFGVGALLTTIYVLKLLIDAIRGASENIRKNQLKYVTVGFGLMGLLNGLNVIPIFGFSLYPPGNFSFLPLSVFAVGLFRHDLLDMGLLIRRSLLYSLLTAVTTGIYALAILAADAAFTGFHASDSILFPICFFILIALVFEPVKKRIQHIVDRLFDKDGLRYRRVITRASESVAYMRDIEEMGRFLTDTLAKSMQINGCVVYLKNDSGNGFSLLARKGARTDAAAPFIADRSPLVRYLTHRRIAQKQTMMEQHRDESHVGEALAEMASASAEVALSMTFMREIVGILLIGSKSAGDLFSREDLDMLTTLAGQSAMAVENARSYRRIEALNRSLERKVQDRTRQLQNALAEKERTQEQLVRSESLASIGQLVAGTAHEMNNPLAAVTSLVQSTIEDLQDWNGSRPPAPEIVEDLKFADKELKRARVIVQSLLDLSRQTQTYAEEVDLTVVVKDALRILRNQYKHKNVSVQCVCPERIPVIHGNFANLGQVMINIIKNALQAVAENTGRIDLTTAYDPKNRQAVFTCRDNGNGIAAKDRGHIFKPFFTTKPVGGGTGLGLYICHEIIRKHGGSIALEKTDPSGTTVSIRLPVSAHPVLSPRTNEVQTVH